MSENGSSVSSGNELDSGLRSEDPSFTTRRSRGWCFTLNNWTQPEYDSIYDHAFSSIVKYAVVGKEVGENQTEHLQGYLYYSNARRFTTVKRFLPRAHLEPAKGTALQNFEYCSKEGDFYEAGDRPKSQREKGDCEKQRWELALTSAKEGRLEDIPADILLRTYSTIKRIRRDFMPTPETFSGVLKDVNVWIWGPAGCGKSSWAREQYTSYFPKSINKWFCGYDHEDCILIDDWAPNHHMVGYYLKIWGDRYPFSAEIKGASILIRPKHVVVTSQYSPETCFPNDPETVSAIRRRFKVINKSPLS